MDEKQIEFKDAVIADKDLTYEEKRDLLLLVVNDPNCQAIYNLPNYPKPIKSPWMKKVIKKYDRQ